MKRFTILMAAFFLLVFIVNGRPVQAEGKEIWEKLQAKEVFCENLSDEDWGALGEYYMGQMTGNSHETMNTMMEQMMGKEGEEQMHMVIGKRLSGCGRGGGDPMMGYGWGNMMSGWGGGLMTLFWLVGLVDLILVGVWLGKQIQKS